MDWGLAVSERVDQVAPPDACFAQPIAPIREKM
jgi:hypothetical protein